MKKIVRISYSLIMSCLFVNCPEYDKFEPDSKIVFINNSDIALLRYIDWYNYPDTTITQGNPFQNIRQKELSLILPNSTKEEIHEIKKIITNSQNNSTIMLYLFSENTVSSVPWDSIRTHYMILKRYDISKEEFQAANWELAITYP